MHYIQQALKANYVMMRDVEYVVEDDRGDHRRSVHRP
ncbi:MAG: hypothetical protein ACLVJ6_02830 [Merdibacter sp.]